MKDDRRCQRCGCTIRFYYWTKAWNTFPMTQDGACAFDHIPLPTTETVLWDLTQVALS